jgi:hypothetical protein
MKTLFSTLALASLTLLTGCSALTSDRDRLVFDNQHRDNLGRIVLNDMPSGCSGYKRSNSIVICLKEDSSERLARESARAANELQGVTALAKND